MTVIEKSLPSDLLAELNRRILCPDDYSKPSMRAWLKGHGFSFSDSTFNRYVNGFRNKHKQGVNLDELPMQFRPSPAEIPTALILREIGMLTFQEEAIRARKLLLLGEVQARQQAPSVSPS